MILESTVNRLSALTLMYDNSYVKKSYSYINLSSFIQNLTSRLINNSEYKDINVEFDLDSEMNLKIQILTPLSLVLNEIISNAIKHGYKDFNSEKKLYISAKIVGSEIGELIIKNNGSKLPDDFDIKNPKTLGLIMITQLIEQIDGELSLTDSEETGFKITFPID